jgi:hypothetical protein
VLSLVIIRYDSEIAGFSGQLGLGVCPHSTALQITQKARRFIGRWLRAITMSIFSAVSKMTYLPVR